MPNPILAETFTEIGCVRHGFFTREGGVSGGIYASLNCGLGSEDAREAVIQNRARVARHLGAKQRDVVTVHQAHTATAIVVDGPIPRDALPKADAVVTAKRGLVIGALAADCAPVLFADPGAGIVAAAHAGWRGAVAGILDATVGAMVGEGAERSRICAAIGPCINQAAYEVGADFEAELLALDPANARFFVRPAAGAKPLFDLPGYVAARLERLRIGSIERRSDCTSANESRYFSYRRSRRLGEPDYGRQISAIVVA